MIETLSKLRRREQPKPLILTLETGQRIALRNSVDKASARPVLIHDPNGFIKEGNPNVVVWKAPDGRQS